MDWFTICKENYGSGYYDQIRLKIFVVKNKITTQQYKEITGIDYVV
ncbi:XkdX family protein [Paenibacillus sp. SI8]